MRFFAVSKQYVAKIRHCKRGKGENVVYADKSGKSPEKEVKFLIIIRSFAILGMGMAGGRMGMKKKKRKTMRRHLSLFLAAAMLMTMQGLPALAETAGETADAARAGVSPSNPVHHCTKQNDGSDTTDWSYVYFGSYPQTEVAGEELTSAITGASYDADGDAWVNGTKYRRISKSDTNYNGNFGDSAYRYFKWERIKWRVLQNDGKTLFVVADKGLDCKDYNEEYASVTWVLSEKTLR